MSTATHQKYANAYSSIDKLLSEIEGQTKTGEQSHTEAGGYQGETEHPVKKEDDRTEEAYEGSRSRENEEDVQEDQGAAGVDGEPVSKAGESQKEGLNLPGNQDDVQMDIGVTSKATGEDSQNETERAKPGKEDGGGYQGASTHPARTDNDDLDGHKWSEDCRQILDRVKKAEDLGTDILATLSVRASADIQKKAQEVRKDNGFFKGANGETQSPGDGQKTGDDQSQTQDQGQQKDAQEQGQQAGSDLAQSVMDKVASMDKQAVYGQVVEDWAQTIQAAYKMADNVAGFYSGLVEGAKGQQQKKGEHDEENSDEGEGTHEPGPEEESSAPPPEMGGGEVPGGGGEEELINALIGGGDQMPMPGGEMGGGEMGGMGGEMGGGEMGGMGGGMPGGEMGGMGGGAMGGMGEIGPEELAMLAAALQQLQASPEAFAKASSSKAAKQLYKLAKAGFQPPQWRPKNAAEGQRFQAIINHISEVLSQ